MRTLLNRTAAMALASLMLASSAWAAEAKPKQSTKAPAADTKVKQSTKSHRLLIQVDQNDPAVMNLALNNATNVIEYYRAKGEDVDVDIVTYGPGLNMLPT